VIFEANLAGWALVLEFGDICCWSTTDVLVHCDTFHEAVGGFTVALLELVSMGLLQD
jgi:hypothetical protein